VGRVVVADGGSTDGSQAIVTQIAGRDDRVRLLDNPDRLQSAGVNRAVNAHGQGFHWFVRIDAHSIYPDHYVTTLLDAARERGAESVVVPMVTRGETCFQRAAAAAQNSVIGTGGAAHRHGEGDGRFVDHGHHALMRTDRFRAVGGYCEAMVCNEDAELDHRLGEAGVAIWLEPRAAIGYLPRKTPQALWRQYFRFGQGRARSLRRHGGRPKLRQMLPLAVPVAFALAALTPLSWVFALPLLAWMVPVALVGVAIGVRRRSLCAMASGPAAMVMHASWGLGYITEIVSHPRGVAPRLGFRPEGN